MAGPLPSEKRKVTPDPGAALVRRSPAPAPAPAPTPPMLRDRVLTMGAPKPAIAKPTPTTTPKPTTTTAAKPVVASKPTATTEGEAPKGWAGWLRDFFFGNIENKFFQIKVNLMHIVTTLQTGPLQPLFTLIERFGALISAGQVRLLGGTASMAQRTSLLGRLVRAVYVPLGAGIKVGVRFLERTAPLFGWLVTGQDVYAAVKVQGDEKATNYKKGLTWASAGFSAIGATASTIVAWCLTGAAATAPTGVGPAALGTIAILCFGASLLTGWLARRQTPKA